MGLDLAEILKIAPAAIIGLTVHEFSHAYAAFKLGDNTAKNEGRLTLNPLKHIDWLGFFLIVIAGFGWAKPVTFNPDNLKNKHKDEILISIAGPISNFLIAIFFFSIARFLYFMDYFHTSAFGLGIVNLIIIWGVINFSLFVFNLIPIPPLDGSHVYLAFLKDINPKLMMNMYKWGTLFLLIIIIAESKFNINILHISDFVNGLTSFFIKLMAFH
ncbi:MAG: site-2 protease family protein [Paludibacter sp.]|nr:site-2 protease family protein [Paludibacter sp.]